MTSAQLIIITLILVTLIFFIIEKIRYDFVALGALIIGVLSGVIPSVSAFEGFGHPAVITVAAVLILSRALGLSGATTLLTKIATPLRHNFTLLTVALCFIAAFLSAFMNNVGALALMMPVAINAAQQADRSPSEILMPLSFASILGGLITLIGTPPNVVIASFREKNLGASFDLFDFTPVGIVIAALGTLFISTIGRKLIPRNRRSAKPLTDLMRIDTYVTELEIQSASKLVGAPHHQALREAQRHEVEILGIIRGKQRLLVVPQNYQYRSGDVLIIEGDAPHIDDYITDYKLVISGPYEEDTRQNWVDPEDLETMEVTVGEHSSLMGRSVEEIRFFQRFNIKLLAVSRQGHSHRGRLKFFRVLAGDVLLLQGERASLGEFVRSRKLLPLANRNLNIGGTRKLWSCLAIFLLAILATVLGITSAPVAFVAGALGMVVFRIIPIREFYECIDWPIIILLGAMIPISNAFETTGAAEYIVTSLIAHITLSPAIIVGSLLIITMFLTDVMNNAATSLIMAPIAVTVAQKLQVSPDTLLMAVAVGASCSFLTPIGHQNNALIMGPGGYKFGDFWRLGLILEIIIALVGIPIILTVWPLQPYS